VYRHFARPQPEINPTLCLTHSLQDARIIRILCAALQAADPEAAVWRYLQGHALPTARRIFVLGLGKAAVAMSRAFNRFTSPAATLIVTKHAAPLEAATVLTAGHPIPDLSSLQAGQAVLQFVSGLQADDLLVCLISGGGSALMSVPQPGLSLDDLQGLTRALLACGARIDEINSLRRHLDQLKGGGLAKATSARVLSLILSDVVGNPLEAIASGPTAPDPSTRWDALTVLKKYDLLATVPAGIVWALDNVPETPKTGDGLFGRVENVIVGSNALAAQSALQQAQSEGFFTQFLGDSWQGEARHVARALCRRLRHQRKSQAQPFCLVAGGETTVTLRGLGSGGRNQELALAAVAHLDGLEKVMLVSLATDGEDGPTPAAGAVVTGQTAQRARSLGMLPATFLLQNDSFTFFTKLQDTLQIGPTGTNVNDLTFLFGL